MDLIRVASSEREESLVIPGGMKLEIFDINNWKFEQASVGTDAPEAVARVVGSCTLDGFEQLAYEWYANGLDINTFGGGDDAKWVEYVKVCFIEALQSKKAQYLQQIKAGLNKAIGLA